MVSFRILHVLYAHLLRHLCGKTPLFGGLTLNDCVGGVVLIVIPNELNREINEINLI